MNKQFPTLRARAIEDFIGSHVLDGSEKSKREVLVKLLAHTNHSINFLAYVTECSMAYVRKVEKSMSNSLAQ